LALAPATIISPISTNTWMRLPSVSPCAAAELAAGVLGLCKESGQVLARCIKQNVGASLNLVGRNSALGNDLCAVLVRARRTVELSQTGDDKGLEVCSLVAAALFNGDALGRLGQVTHAVNRASLDLVGRD